MTSRQAADDNSALRRECTPGLREGPRDAPLEPRSLHRISPGIAAFVCLALLFSGTIALTSAFDPGVDPASIAAIGAVGVMLAAGVAGIFAHRAQAALTRACDQIDRLEILLGALIDNIPMGVGMFNRRQQLILHNVKFRTLYRLDREHCRAGSSFRSILQARLQAGQLEVDPEAYLAQQLGGTTAEFGQKTTTRLRDGGIVELTQRPLDGGGWLSIHADITAQKELEAALTRGAAALQASNFRFNAALQNMSQGLCLFDAAGKVVVVNDRYREIYGLPEGLIRPGTLLREILEYRRALGNFDGPDIPVYLAEYVQKPNETQSLIGGRFVLITRRHLSEGGMLTTHEDITERRHNEARIAFMAHHDSLTGLLNRAAFVEKLADAAAGCRRFDESFNVLALDLDGFKQVNDTYGHNAGDELLIQVALRLKTSLLDGDRLARLGGDEFAIIQIASVAPRDAALALASQIVACICEPFSIDGNNVFIGTSIGIALAPGHSADPDDLLKMADLALYSVKARGRNGYAFFDPAMGRAAVERHEMESDLRTAIERGEFELLYQPIVETKTLSLCSAEALIRWNHPRHGSYQPDRFIPLAEETGLIAKIGEWVILTACMEAARWPDSVKVAVNISPVQLRDPFLVDIVMCALVTSGLNPERLELEITETALIENGPECLTVLHRFRRLGVSIALDDFGTGYSSLSYLAMFPFDKIKIDKSFTQNMESRPECSAIISAVLAMANSLNIATTAEGVETEQQLRLLRLLGVSSIQGYLIGRPGQASSIVVDPSASLKVIDDVA